MTDTTVDLSFLARQMQTLIEEARLLRKEVSAVRTIGLQAYDYMRRVERRQVELRDDLEITIKMELGGALTHLQTGLDTSLGRIEEKVDTLAERIDALERKP